MSNEERILVGLISSSHVGILVATTPSFEITRSLHANIREATSSPGVIKGVDVLHDVCGLVDGL